MPNHGDLRRRLPGPWAQRGSLFVPPTHPQRHGEMDNIKAYVKYSELAGTQPTLNAFISSLRDVGLRSLLFSLSRLLTVLHVDGVHRQDLQAFLRDQVLTPIMLGRLRRLPNWSERVLFFPQQILFTAKMAILHAPDRDDRRPDSEFRDVIVELLLMSAEFLDQIELPESRRDLEQILIAHQVRSYLISPTEQVRYMIPRASLLYLKLPLDPELRSDSDFLDLPAAFRTATGFDLKDYLAFGVAIFLWFSQQSHLRRTYQQQRESLNPHTFFSESKINPNYARRLLDTFVHTYDTARAAFDARLPDAHRLTYDFLPFIARPLYQIRDNIIVPIHLGYLEARFTNAIYWTISDSLPNHDRLRFRRFFGRIFENYVRRALLRAIPDHPSLARRLFPEFTYSTPHGDRKTSDLVVLYPRTAIFIEVTATRIRLEATAISGDLRAFEEDVGKIILANARQMTHRIRDFRQGLYAFAGVTRNDIDRIFPVVVTINSIPESTPIWNHILGMLTDRGLLMEPGVERLQLIDVEELDMLEPVLSQGLSLLDILEARSADNERRNIGLKNFLIARFPGERANEFLRSEYDDIGQHAKSLFFGDAQSV
jgi:hypothetical protein